MLTLHLILTNDIKFAHVCLFDIGINITFIRNTIKKFFQPTFDVIELIITHIEITPICVGKRCISFHISEFTVYF